MADLKAQIQDLATKLRKCKTNLEICTDEDLREKLEDRIKELTAGSAELNTKLCKASLPSLSQDSWKSHESSCLHAKTLSLHCLKVDCWSSCSLRGVMPPLLRLPLPHRASR